LIRWAGDDPDREGLLDTPARVARAYEEWFCGYGQDPAALLGRTFGETGGYAEMVLLKDIPVNSVCEHHMAPIRGVAHVAYLPGERVVGISKLARLVEAYSRRLQIQEKLTAQIAETLEASLKPRGVAVAISAEHGCMASRGVYKPGVAMVTRRLTGAFEADPLRREFLAAAGL
jgi:GTP cyclohydrolase I